MKNNSNITETRNKRMKTKEKKINKKKENINQQNIINYRFKGAFVVLQTSTNT